MNLPTLSSQFELLPKATREAILKEIATNGSSDNGATPFSLNLAPKNGLEFAVSGPIFKKDTAKYQGPIGPLTKADVAALTPEIASVARPPVGALTMAAPERRAQPDITEMLSKFVPEDDSSGKYLAMAAAFGRPTGFGTFGETMANVADALNEQKMNQQKLRAQYAPLIMQQVAQQQAREEQQLYRLEAQRQAQEAKRMADAQAQQFRAEQAALGRQSAEERAAADRALREQLAADRAHAAGLTRAEANKPPTGYAWGPITADGNPSLVAIKGGPADAKIAGALNADTQALVGMTSSLDRLAAAANQVLNHPGLPGITGLRGKIPNIPGSDAANADALLETLKSQVGFSVLQDMRNQSKTGGALGSVTEKELAMLQSNLAALNKAQSVEQFGKSLEQIIAYVDQAKDRMRQAYNVKHGDAQISAPQDAPQKPLPSQAEIAAEIARRKKGG